MRDGKPGFYISIGEAWFGDCEGDSGLDHADGWGDVIAPAREVDMGI